ncbi:hypothetical protein [Tardiphaga sp. OK245]|uniref:hypothetical protein n=1 Tax=Tardiphaga sp. OK245 TaxID=1855306 RepID=UPI000B8905B3|nr:hypothetical protein [Tardiphaga sp. OK245]
MRARRQEAEQKEAAEKTRVAQMEQALRQAAQERGETLRADAVKHGSDWIAWIETGHPELNGITPWAAATAVQFRIAIFAEHSRPTLTSRTKEFVAR